MEVNNHNQERQRQLLLGCSVVDYINKQSFKLTNIISLYESCMSEEQIEKAISLIIAFSESNKILKIENVPNKAYFNIEEIFQIDFPAQELHVKHNFSNKINNKLKEYALNPFIQCIVFRHIISITVILQSASRTCRLVTNLCIQDCLIGDEGVRYIWKAQWRFIKEITLHNNSITTEGAHFLSLCCWDFLATLKMRSNSIKNRGLQWLLKGNWPRLTVFQVIQADLTPDCARMIPKMYWNRLKILSLSQTHHSFEFTHSILSYLQYTNTKSLKSMFLVNSSQVRYNYGFEQQLQAGRLAKVMRPNMPPLTIYHDLNCLQSNAIKQICKLGYVRLKCC